MLPWHLTIPIKNGRTCTPSERHNEQTQTQAEHSMQVHTLLTSYALSYFEQRTQVRIFTRNRLVLQEVSRVCTCHAPNAFTLLAYLCSYGRLQNRASSCFIH